jgi:hypothetical protein
MHLRLFVILVLPLCGCAAHAVRCDGRLQPINGPPPAAATPLPASPGSGAAAAAPAAEQP